MLLPGHQARLYRVTGGSDVYAVVKSGGRQFRASVGDTILVDRLPAAAGERLELGEVLLVASDEHIEIGHPTVDGAKVVATVLAQEKGPKIHIFKYRPKERYRQRGGHRQLYTRLRVDEIVA